MLKAISRLFLKDHPKERVSVDRDDATAMELQAAGVHVVSFPKCGRTWLSNLYYHYFMHRYQADRGRKQHVYKPELSEGFVQLLAEHPEIPTLAFTHALQGRGKNPYYKYKPGLAGLEFKREPGGGGLGDKPIVFLARDPRDVVVSYYHHVMAKGYGHPSDVTLSEFLRSELFGIRFIVAYYNAWVPLIREQPARVHLLTYEQVTGDVSGSFATLLKWLGVDDVSDASVAAAVKKSSFERMKEVETRAKKHDTSTDNNRLRMRKGQVGGYRDELSSSDIEYVEHIIDAHLDDFYSYYKVRHA